MNALATLDRMTTEAVLQAMDESFDRLSVGVDRDDPLRETCEALAEARAAVAEIIAERDRLREAAGQALIAIVSFARPVDPMGAQS